MCVGLGDVAADPQQASQTGAEVAAEHQHVDDAQHEQHVEGAELGAPRNHRSPSSFDWIISLDAARGHLTMSGALFACHHEQLHGFYV